MTFSVQMIADSISLDGVRLTTMEVTFPRIILAEFNTHRMFSRNSASSRAIPVRKMLDRVKDEPFVPIHWGKNEKGMQASEELTGAPRDEADFTWRELRNHVRNAVHHLAVDLDVHKQTANRLLEPWLWHTVVVTATEWENFFNLRTDKAAQPEMQRIARMMRDCYQRGEPAVLGPGTWHLPYIVKEDIEGMSMEEYIAQDPLHWAKISCARCARVSTLTHDGKRDIAEDLALAERLLKAGHMSPFEHAARPLAREECVEQLTQFSGVAAVDPLDIDPSEHFCGNFRGWKQYRKLLPNEAVWEGGAS